MKININLWKLVEFSFEREKFQTKVAEKTKTHIFRSITLFLESFILRDNVEKYSTARHAKALVIHHALYMLDN